MRLDRCGQAARFCKGLLVKIAKFAQGSAVAVSDNDKVEDFQLEKLPGAD
jgi:hypothetical protein